ncbi:MAG: GNAT family N-acetyltransferase [Sulfurimonas sp.]|nr:GNAT family N-acetyltransferase [Sulfurimonas sp.]
MQIREMSLKELYPVYDLVKQLRVELSYKEFEDLIYEMRHINYKMFGVLERGELMSYAGVSIITNLYHKRHLFVYDLVTDEKHRNKGYAKEMLKYLDDFAKTSMCENIVLSSDLQKEDAHIFYENNAFKKKSIVFLKEV